MSLVVLPSLNRYTLPIFFEQVKFYVNMNLLSAVVVFFLIWWTALFTVLPFSISRDETGKPNDPKIKEKFIMTTLVSVVIWAIIYILIEMDIISFREMANIMVVEDRRL